jgi:hypothetical protein
MTDVDEDCWTFFWKWVTATGNCGIQNSTYTNPCSNNGESSGVGTGCIKSPDDGTCGCENSDGTFVYGGTNCS